MPYNTETQAKEPMTVFYQNVEQKNDSYWVEYDDCYVEYSFSDLQKSANDLGVSFEYYVEEFL